MLATLVSRLSLAFWLTALVVAALGIHLSRVNHSDGGWDSASNLVTARNVAQGRGFTTDIVQDLVAPAELPGRETVRTPGPVYLLGAVFRAWKVTLAAPVLVNLVTVLASAILFRLLVRRIAPSWLADFTGILLLLTNSDFRLVPFGNNDLLVLLTICALFLATVQWTERWPASVIGVAAALLTAASFLTKQSYVLSMVPFTIVLLMTDRRNPILRRFALLCGAGAIVLVLTSVYWWPNLVHFGTPVYSPIQQLRLPVRYGTVPFVGYQRMVFIGKPAPTYHSMIATIGLHEALRRELDVLRQLAPTAAARGLLVMLWALAGLVFARRRRAVLYAAAGILLIAPIFDAVWWLPEDRYLYPLFAISLFLAVLGTVGYREAEQTELTASGRRRFRTAFVALMSCVVAATVLDARWGWRSEFKSAQVAPPAWAEAISRLPENAVVLTAWPPYVAWWGRRAAVMEPWGTRADLVTVTRLYHPTAYFAVELENTEGRAPFAPDELQLLEEGTDWRLYQIVRDPR